MTRETWGDRPPWLVQVIRSATAAPSGAGVFCGDCLVLTCAHVVERPAPEEPPAGEVYVRFEFCGSPGVLAAEVLPGGWFPQVDQDVAVLRLKEDPPADAVAAPLHSTATVRVRGHEATAHGYLTQPSAVPAELVVAGFSGGGDRLTIRSRTNLGFAVQPGFSGAPVWDDRLQGVIGIVVSRLVPPKDKEDIKTGFATTVDAVSRIWPQLRRLVQVPGAAEALELLQGCLALPLTPDGELPTVGEVSAYDLGVALSPYTRNDDSPPYVPRRRLDRALEQALGTSSSRKTFVLAIGGVSSGKSRSTVELLRRTMPQARLIVPADDPSALRWLAKASLPLDEAGGVLWLDDLGRFLVPNGLDLTTLELFIRHDPAVKVVATISAGRKERVLLASGKVGRTAMAVLARASEVPVPVRLDDEDLQAAAEHYPDEDFREQGIGPRLAGAQQLATRYRGAQENSPEGWAVLQAAVDWRRIGLDAPVPEATLRDLFAGYLDLVRPGADPDTAFRQGLGWALDPHADGVVLLRRLRALPDPKYRVVDYVVELATRGDEGRPIPRASWDRIVASVPALDLLRVMFAAMSRGLVDVARNAGRRAREQADSADVQAWATLLTGYAAMQCGDEAAAVDLLTEATHSTLPGVQALAAVDLAVPFLNSGKLDQAGELLNTALASGETQVQQLAKANLGVVLMRRGDTGAAQALFEEVLAAGDSSATLVASAHGGELIVKQESRGGGQLSQKGWAARPAPDDVDHSSLFSPLFESSKQLARGVAENALGGLLMSRGELPRARTLLRSALQSGDPRVVPVAQASLGMLALDENDVDAARRLLREALASGHLDAAPWATVGLAKLAEWQGDIDAARDGLTRVAEGIHVEYAPMAADLLGDLLSAQGEREAAEAAYRKAIGSGHRQWQPTAMIDLARLLGADDDPGQRAAAEQLLSDVADGPHPDLAPQAADLLGDLFADQGDAARAAASYRRAIASGHRDSSVIATIDLALLLCRADAPGEVARGRRLLEEVAGGSHEYLAPAAVDLLGDHFAAAGNVEAAKAAYERAVASGHKFWMPRAQIDLAVLAANVENDFARAAELAAAAAAADDVSVSALARLAQGTILLVQDRLAEARQYLTAAVDSGVDEVASGAQLQLARVSAAEGDLSDAVARLDASLPSTGPAGEPPPGAEGRAALRYMDHCDFLFNGGDLELTEELLERLRTGPLAERAPELVPAAGARLARVRLVQQRLDDARALSEDALASGHPAAVPVARWVLGSVLLLQGDPRRARDTALPLANAADREERALGLHLLGRIASSEGKAAEAAGWLRRAMETAIEAGDTDTASAARDGLAALQAVAPGIPAARAAADTRAGAAAPAGPTRAPALGPGRPEADGDTGTRQRVGRAEADGGAVTEQRHGIAAPPLPQRVLALLAEVAAAEGAEEEAREWASLAQERATRRG